MTLFEIGRLCVKLAGRDAGKQCAVVEIIDDHYVLVDGLTRRKKVNIRHLEPLADILDIASGAAHDEVIKALGHHGLAIPHQKARTRAAKQPQEKTPRKGAHKEGTSASSKAGKKAESKAKK